MNVTASRQLGLNNWCERSETHLSDEQTHHTMAIVQERHLLSRPMGSARKMICHQQSLRSDTSSEKGTQHTPTVKDQRHLIVNKIMGLMPLFTWLPQLNWSSVKSDLVAGLTVGVMVIPQSVSYASIAGLPYIVGMYSACVPPMVYAFFGQSRQLAVGPVAMVSLLVESGLRGKLTYEECPEWHESGAKIGHEQYEICPEAYMNLAFLTAAMVGIMQLAACFFRLGFLVSFLGHPVISGFTSGAAIIIGLSQLKYVLGITVPKSELMYVTLMNIVERLGNTQPVTLILGITFIVLLFANKKISQRIKSLSMLGPMGPLLACLVGTLLVWLYAPLREVHNVKYVGEIPSGSIPISIQNWKLDDIPRVLPTATTAVLIGYMESIAIGKNLATKHRYDLNPGQELLALGAANLVGAMFSCYPVAGSFSRSAVSNSTGAVSQFAGLVTALVMLCTLRFLTPMYSA